MKKTIIAALVFVPATFLGGCTVTTAGYYPANNYAYVGYYGGSPYWGNYYTGGWGNVGYWRGYRGYYNRGWWGGGRRWR